MPVIINGTTGISGLTFDSVNVTANLTVSNTLSVTGNVAVANNISVSKDTSLTGNVVIGSKQTTLDVNAAALFRSVGSEGGEINFYNPDNIATGLVIDVGSANNARIFSTQTNMTMDIGQLVGTGGRIGFYTATTERMRVASDGSFSAVIPSGSTLYPSFWTRAWVNFNGTGTVAIRGSGGVTSISDNGTGDYTVNFSFTMPDANYSISIACADASWTGPTSKPQVYTSGTVTTTGARIAYASAGTFYDPTGYYAAFCR